MKRIDKLREVRQSFCDFFFLIFLVAACRVLGLGFPRLHSSIFQQCHCFYRASVGAATTNATMSEDEEVTPLFLFFCLVRFYLTLLSEISGWSQALAASSPSPIPSFNFLPLQNTICLSTASPSSFVLVSLNLSPKTLSCQHHSPSTPTSLETFHLGCSSLLPRCPLCPSWTARTSTGATSARAGAACRFASASRASVIPYAFIASLLMSSSLSHHFANMTPLAFRLRQALPQLSRIQLDSRRCQDAQECDCMALR